MTAQRDNDDLAASAFVCSCILATLVLLTVTRQWLEVAFFTFFLILGLLQLLAPGLLRRSGTEPVLRRQLSRLQVGFWILTLAAAVVQLGTPAAAEAPVIVWWIRFIAIFAWSSIWNRRHRPT